MFLFMIHATFNIEREVSFKENFNVFFLLGFKFVDREKYWSLRYYYLKKFGMWWLKSVSFGVDLVNEHFIVKF